MLHEPVPALPALRCHADASCQADICAAEARSQKKWRPGRQCKCVPQARTDLMACMHACHRFKHMQ